MIGDLSMQFKVVALGDNTKNFGLRKLILIGRDGQGLSALGNHLRWLSVGTVLDLGDGNPIDALIRRGFECPERLSQNASLAVCREVWGQEALGASQSDPQPKGGAIRRSLRSATGRFRLL
jgi:hypothetical protein